MSEQQTLNSRNEIITGLLMGKCLLTYSKINGDERVASGTLNRFLIPEDRLPKNNEHLENGSRKEIPSNDALVHYFDLDVNGWRAFWPENLKTLKVL
jgi:hypothetical protein